MFTPSSLTLSQMKDDFLSILSNLSVRSTNVCISNGLTDKSSFLDYYKINKTFKGLRNCGAWSNNELIELSESLLQLDNLSNNIVRFSIDDIHLLSRAQRQVVSEYLQINFNQLSNRSKNALTVYLGEKLNLFNFCEKILFNKSFSFENLRNIGSVSISELISFVDTIDNFINEVYSIKDDRDLINYRCQLILNNLCNADSIPLEVSESRSIFKILEYMISNSLLLTGNKGEVLRNTFNITLNSNIKTPNELSQDLKLTRERIRQLRNHTIEELLQALDSICSIETNILEHLGYSAEPEYIILTNKEADIINIKNATNFTPQFLTLIISKSLKDFLVIGNIEDAVTIKYSQSKHTHTWKNIYLLNKKFVETINIEDLVQDLSNRIKVKITESYKLNFINYISRFGLLNNDCEEALISFCETIIKNELDLYVDINDDIQFERTTIKTLPEYIEEILEDIGEPCTAEKLYGILLNMDKDLTKSIAALRGTCNRMESLIYFGRSSTYGLKKWESQYNHIKGGTIKDIAVEYLVDKSRPVHIVELLGYVNKYRDTSIKSLLNNISTDPFESFIIYTQSFVGLVINRAKYDEEKYVKIPKHLGKIIMGLVDSKKVSSKNDLVIYLQTEYNLDNGEANCILEKLSETSPMNF